MEALLDLSHYHVTLRRTCPDAIRRMLTHVCTFAKRTALRTFLADIRWDIPSATTSKSIDSVLKGGSSGSGVNDPSAVDKKSGKNLKRVSNKKRPRPSSSPSP